MEWIDDEGREDEEDEEDEDKEQNSYLFKTTNP